MVTSFGKQLVSSQGSACCSGIDLGSCPTVETYFLVVYTTSVTQIVVFYNSKLLFTMCSYVPGQPLTVIVQRIEIEKLRQGPNLILGFSIGGGIDQDPGQNPFSDDKTDKGIYVTRITPDGPADRAGLKMGDKIMQVNGWDMTMVPHDQARKRLTKKNEDVVRLLVNRKSLEDAVKQSMGNYPREKYGDPAYNQRLMQ